MKRNPTEFLRRAAWQALRAALTATFALALFLAPKAAHADGNLNKVNHIIIVMQENHSFDNYFGPLAYAPGSPYHAPGLGTNGCPWDDHNCVDGLSCMSNADGSLSCSNANLDDNGSTVYSFHEPSRCVKPDLNHGWVATHQEINFANPNDTLFTSLSDGFVRVNDATDQPDNGSETPTEDNTIGYFDQSDIPFYYNLAENFSIDDRYFASMLGPTFPNRAYFAAATSFGHLTTNEIVPPAGGYKPVTGTIFDLLEKSGVSWADYFQDVPQAAIFHPLDSHMLPLVGFYLQLAFAPDTLPHIILLDPNLGATGTLFENDEHPPTDIQRGQAFVSSVVSVIRRSAIWKDSIIFITYDEHGGYYDHAQPPRSPQEDQRTPDGISPGQCADLSNPPASLQPGGGANCSTNLFSTTDTSVKDAEALCPALAANPTGAYPDQCVSFDQLGVRVPLIAVSPFSKPHYVSHTIGDHTSLLALIEKRFLSASGQPLHLTLRDQSASTLEDLFDFDASPSLQTPITEVHGPANDCTPFQLPGSL